MTFAEYAFRLMSENDMTYQEISDRSGVHINTVQNYIKAKTKNLSYDKAKNILRALGGDISMLDQFEDTAGDPIIAEAAKSVPTDPVNHQLYEVNDKLIMSYQAALSRERSICRILSRCLIIVTVMLFIVTGSIIALFAYDFTHDDRGWYQDPETQIIYVTPEPSPTAPQ